MSRSTLPCDNVAEACDICNACVDGAVEILPSLIPIGWLGERTSRMTEPDPMLMSMVISMPSTSDMTTSALDESRSEYACVPPYLGAILVGIVNLVHWAPTSCLSSPMYVTLTATVSPAGIFPRVVEKTSEVGP